MRLTREAWSWTVSCGLIGAAAATVASLFAPLGWPFELFAHFRWQLGVAALALLLASVALRRPWMLSVAFATLALQALPTDLLAQRAKAHGLRAACGAAELRVASVNVFFAGTDHAPVLAWLAQSKPDVIALQEVTPAWADALESLAATYPHRMVLARDDPYGIAILSRWPLTDTASVDFAGDGRPSLVATVDLGGKSLRLIALHTRWPMLPSLQVARDIALQRAAALARSQPESTILLGDLNLTPYAPAFGRLVAESNLRDAFDKKSWRPTWLAGFWPLALPIDHVLVPRGSCDVVPEIGPAVGSDHRPIQVALRLP